MVILDLQIILIQFNSVPSENNANNCGRQPKAYISAYGKQPNVITLYLPLVNTRTHNKNIEFQLVSKLNQ